MLFYDCDMIYYETSNHAMFVHIAHFSFFVKVRGSQFCKASSPDLSRKLLPKAL